MPAQLERSWTADEVRRELLTDRAWPRYELIDGERWRPDDERPEIIRERMTWRPADATAALEFAVADLFAAGHRIELPCAAQSAGSREACGVEMSVARE